MKLPDEPSPPPEERNIPAVKEKLSEIGLLYSKKEEKTEKYVLKKVKGYFVNSVIAEETGEEVGLLERLKKGKKVEIEKDIVKEIPKDKIEERMRRIDPWSANTFTEMSLGRDLESEDKVVFIAPKNPKS
ncbi:MAG: hypothetical protein MUP58_02965 [Candidatus Nanohaloarchaeota archaeon QJJ-9]|nr:hypothetical protein [Candidatus Nanohaloarchaeota archaeon QJJ-9]